MISPEHALKPALQGIALAGALLLDDLSVGSQAAGDLARAVCRATVDHDHLVEIARQARKHVREVLDLVEGRDDDADAWTFGQLVAENQSGAFDRSAVRYLRYASDVIHALTSVRVLR